MPGFEKTSEQPSAATIVAGDQFLGVQSSATVLYTAAQIKTFVDGTGITGTTIITGEYVFKDGNTLDYSGSLSDAMSAAVLTITELPSSTAMIHVNVRIRDTTTNPAIGFNYASGGTTIIDISGLWGDAGTNLLRGVYWFPTVNNTIYIKFVSADTEIKFEIIGYKTGA